MIQKLSFFILVLGLILFIEVGRNFVHVQFVQILCTVYACIVAIYSYCSVQSITCTCTIFNVQGSDSINNTITFLINVILCLHLLLHCIGKDPVPEGSPWQQP